MKVCIHPEAFGVAGAAFREPRGGRAVAVIVTVRIDSGGVWSGSGQWRHFVSSRGGRTMAQTKRARYMRYDNSALAIDNSMDLPNCFTNPFGRDKCAAFGATCRVC